MSPFFFKSFFRFWSLFCWPFRRGVGGSRGNFGVCSQIWFSSLLFAETETASPRSEFPTLQLWHRFCGQNPEPRYFCSFSNDQLRDGRSVFLSFTTSCDQSTTAYISIWCFVLVSNERNLKNDNTPNAQCQVQWALDVLRVKTSNTENVDENTALVDLYAKWRSLFKLRFLLRVPSTCSSSTKVLFFLHKASRSFALVAGPVSGGGWVCFGGCYSVSL